MRTLRAASFLVKAPFLVAILFIINLVTSPHHWWVQWPVLGIAIAWGICLIRVACFLVVAGGLTAIVTLLWNKRPFDAIRRRIG